MSPSDPPLGLPPFDTVLAPYAFCVAVPNPLVEVISAQAIVDTVNVLALGLKKRDPSSFCNPMLPEFAAIRESVNTIG